MSLKTELALGVLLLVAVVFTGLAIWSYLGAHRRPRG